MAGRTSNPQPQPPRPHPPAPKPRLSDRRRRRRGGHRRSCCCACLLWLFLLFIALSFLLATAAGALYVFAGPRRPSFSVSSLTLAHPSPSGRLRLDLAVTFENPNRRLVFRYGPISVAVISNGVKIGEGAFPAFVHGTENTTVMRAAAAAAGPGRAVDLKGRGWLAVEVHMRTRVKVKIGRIETRRIEARVWCGGIEMKVTKGRKGGGAAAAAATERGRCEVTTPIQIWKWRFYL